MKRMATGIAILCLLTGTIAVAEDAPDPKLSEKECEELVRLLDDSFANLLDLISGLTEEQWNFKPNEDRWSVGECVEHIARSEQALLDSAVQAMKNDPDPEWAEKTKGKTDLIRNVMPNRNPGGRGGASAPQEIRPTEKWDRATAIKRIYEVRGEVRAFTETVAFEAPMREHIVTHPFEFFGDLSAYDWLIYVPLHTIRHSRQIIEVQEDPNYPKD